MPPRTELQKLFFERQSILKQIAGIQIETEEHFQNLQIERLNYVDTLFDDSKKNVDSSTIYSILELHGLCEDFSSKNSNQLDCVNRKELTKKAIEILKRYESQKELLKNKISCYLEEKETLEQEYLETQEQFKKEQENLKEKLIKEQQLQLEMEQEKLKNFQQKQQKEEQEQQIQKLMKKFEIQKEAMKKESEKVLEIELEKQKEDLKNQQLILIESLQQQQDRLIEQQNKQQQEHQKILLSQIQHSKKPINNNNRSVHQDQFEFELNIIKTQMEQLRSSNPETKTSCDKVVDDSDHVQNNGAQDLGTVPEGKTKKTVSAISTGGVRPKRAYKRKQNDLVKNNVTYLCEQENEVQKSGTLFKEEVDTDLGEIEDDVVADTEKGKEVRNNKTVKKLGRNQKKTLRYIEKYVQDAKDEEKILREQEQLQREKQQLESEAKFKKLEKELLEKKKKEKAQQEKEKNTEEKKREKKALALEKKPEPAGGNVVTKESFKDRQKREQREKLTILKQSLKSKPLESQEEQNSVQNMLPNNESDDGNGDYDTKEKPVKINRRRGRNISYHESDLGEAIGGNDSENHDDDDDSNDDDYELETKKSKIARPKIVASKTQPTKIVTRIPRIKKTSKTMIDGKKQQGSQEQLEQEAQSNDDEAVQLPKKRAKQTKVIKGKEKLGKIEMEIAKVDIQINPKTVSKRQHKKAKINEEENSQSNNTNLFKVNLSLDSSATFINSTSSSPSAPSSIMKSPSIPSSSNSLIATVSSKDNKVPFTKTLKSDKQENEINLKSFKESGQNNKSEEGKSTKILAKKQTNLTGAKFMDKPKEKENIQQKARPPDLPIPSGLFDPTKINLKSSNTDGSSKSSSNKGVVKKRKLFGNRLNKKFLLNL